MNDTWRPSDTNCRRMYYYVCTLCRVSCLQPHLFLFAMRWVSSKHLDKNSFYSEIRYASSHGNAFHAENTSWTSISLGFICVSISQDLLCGVGTQSQILHSPKYVFVIDCTWIFSLSSDCLIAGIQTRRDPKRLSYLLNCMCARSTMGTPVASRGFKSQIFTPSRQGRARAIASTARTGILNSNRNYCQISSALLTVQNIGDHWPSVISIS